MDTKTHFEPQEQGQLPVAMDVASVGIQEVGDLVDHMGPEDLGQAARPQEFAQAVQPQDLGHANLNVEAERLYEDHGELNRKYNALKSHNEEVKNMLLSEQKTTAALNSENVELKKKLRQMDHDRDLYEHLLNEQKKTAALISENVELKKKLGQTGHYQDLYEHLLKRNTFLKSEVDELKAVNGKSRCDIALQEQQIKELEDTARQARFRAEEEHKLAMGFQKQSQDYKEQLDGCAALYDLQQQKISGMAKHIEKLTRQQQLLRPPARVLPEELSVQERHRFRIEQVNDHFRCTRCHKSPGEEDDTCNYHPTASWPYVVWKVWFPQEEGFGPEFFFWPCCQKFGIKEPTGCQSMEEHQF